DLSGRPETCVEEADQIYLLMKEEYRISRNVRLAWFIGKLNQVVWPASKPELLNSENELDLLSILPKGWQPDFFPTMYPCMLMPSTRATFLARRYRFIIELDLSPSTGIVDDSTGEMIFDEVFHALSRCLAGLAQPFQVPGTDQLFKPKIFVTILAYSSIIGLTSHQVLVQGCQLDRIDLDEFLHHIYQQLRAVESNIAQVLHQQHEQPVEPIQCLPNNISDDQLHRKQGISMVSADMSLVSMVRQGILALQLLPPNSSSGIIIITDGVTSVPDVAVCETLLNQLRSGTIACSFVQVGGAYSYDCSFGYIPNVELMKFISLATFGSYLPTCPEVDLNSQEMNAYHKAFLTYSFLKTPESMNSEYFCVSQHKLFNEHLVSASGNPALVMRRKKHTEKEVHAHLISVVSVRLREGYTIREISLTKGGTQLEVKLVLLWKHNMHIEYLAAASWPLDHTKRTTRVEVTMEGSYDILHDISCTQRKPIASPYRTSVIRRFWNTLQSINQTDQMLVHLQSFNSVPENYMIPESTKNGVPLFYIPPGSTTPVLSLQHSGSKDSSQSQFASYWKPILSMDANFWQRWLHMHRITIILEHDMPVPKHLHTAGNNGRYSTIQCRISHSALTSLLRDWSSFVLVEGYSYVKLIYSSSDQPPTSFYLVRLISKTPCMVLRLGFPIGTPAHVRNKIVDELREQILKLRFPHRVQNKEVTPKTKRKVVGNPSPSKSPSIPSPKPALSDRPCVVVLNKPLEKLLIRYEKLPLDFRTPFIFNMENFPQPSNNAVPLSMAANRTASSTLASLSRYFLHQRWVWAVQSNQGSTVAMQAVAHILSMLSEIRISEGFHFAASGEGIVNMVIELTVMFIYIYREKHSCIVQYILFPPHSTSTKDSFSTDDDNDTEVEAVDVDVELNLVTECWVEPQSGTVMNCMDQHRHFQGLKYQEIPQAIFPRDLACMSTMMTFEYLSQLCQNKEQVCSLPAELKDVRGKETHTSEDSISMVPFQFDLIQLLPKCQQVELFFLTFSTVENEEQVHSSSCLPNELLLSLFHNSLEHELSDREIPLADGDHLAFMHQILERERDGHDAPFSLPVIKGQYFNADLVDEEPLLGERSCSTQRWRCYIKNISSQQILLTFVPASFRGTCSRVLYNVASVLLRFSTPFSECRNVICGYYVYLADVLMLMTSGLETEPQTHVSTQEDDTMTPKGVQFSEPQKADFHVIFSRDVSQPSTSDSCQLKCPVYVYSCSLEQLKEQLVHPTPSRQPRDIFFRYCAHLHPSHLTDLLTQPHKHNELASYCSLLQEHYHQCYVKGVYRSLQQSYSISSQDVLMAMDYCEESLQEIDVTSFLHTLCGHIRVFWEHGEAPGWGGDQKPSRNPATFHIGEVEDDQPDERAAMASSSSIEMEDASEYKTPKIPEFSLTLLQTQPKCEVYPDLHKIIQDKFMEIISQYFKTVPSNPHYFFYCPSSSKIEDSEDGDLTVLCAENVLGCCIMMESDTDLVVEYEEQPGTSFHTEGEDQSLSDSNTVNQDQDSFSILEGDSLLESEGPQLDMPPLFVHVTCSVNMKSCHGSMPIQTLPTCLGEIISCLENAEALQSVDLNELSVTLDIFVLTLPLEIEVMANFHHNRYTSESSVSLNRSPGQPSSYRSDEELIAVLDSLRGASIRWLLEDEIVSALRHSRVISLATLQKVAEHVLRSSGQPHCHCEDVPLQFVFGPELSLEKFKEHCSIRCLLSPLPLIKESEVPSLILALACDCDPVTINLLREMSFCLTSGCGKPRPSRVQSVVSSQGSLDSDMQGYDGGSSDSECESPTLDEQECQSALMPDFWLIVKIYQDRVKVYSHSRSAKKEDQELPEYLKLHQMVVRKISEICRIVNQRMLLQDLHDSHVCNSLLVAESEEDIWKNESLYRQRLNTSDDYNTEESYQARDYLAATMQFVPGHFACDVVWSTIIHIHPRLKMGPNMGVARAIQALRSVLNSFCVVNRKNMFVYQERTTKSVFYLRLCETSLTGKYCDVDGNLQMIRSSGLARSQEPLFSDDLMGSRSSLDSSRQVGQVDKHILLLVHGIGNAGPEITDELVKVLRKRLDETTLDIITVMLVRNCKLTPADVEFIQPSGSPATEVMTFSLPQYCLSWLPAVAHYLRQNLLIFLHVPKYTDSNTAHHFKHYFHLSSDLADGDIYLYNKPGGQGTGGKGNHILVQCLLLFFLSVTNFTVMSAYLLTEPQLYVHFDIWEQGNVSPLQLSDKLQGALRHALCDVVMELRVLPNPLCVGLLCPATKAQREEVKGTSTPESTTPTSKSTRRSFWDILSKSETSELGSPKTTDDIVQEKGEEGRAARRRHKTENIKQQWSQEKAMAVELEQAQRRQVSQLEEGDVGTLHPVYQVTCEPWITFMAKLGCPSIQQCTAEIASHFLLPSILSEIVHLVTFLASDTTVKAFEKRRAHVCGMLSGFDSYFFSISLSFSLLCPAHKGFQRFEALDQCDSFSPSQAGVGLAPRQRFLLISIQDKKVTLYSYNWSVDLGASLNRELVRLVKWQNARAHVVHCLLNQKMGLFHHYCFSDAPIHEIDSKQDPNPFLSPSMEPDALLRSTVPPLPSKEQGRLLTSGRSLAPLHFPSELLPFDEALRDVCTIRPLMEGDVVAKHGGQLLDIKAAERRELEKQMKIENLFVTWQQRSAQSNMPISGTDLETLKQSSRLVHYCATPLLFDPIFRKQIHEEQVVPPDSTASGRDRSYSTDSADMLPSRLKDEPWLLEISSTFLQQYVQYLQSMGFILVQVRPQSPARSSMSSEGRMSFSYVKQKSEDSPKVTSGTTAYHLQRALPGGIVLMELAFQGCYFCVKQYALECSRIPMGQTVNSQLSMLFTEECDKVRDLMHVHSFSYDFHLRVVHQYLVGCHMTLRQGYQLTDFLDDFISHHPDIPKFGRNHVFQGSFSISTRMITAHQLYNYITDHASTYSMKPLRMSKSTVTSDNKKGMPEMHEYALVALWNSSGSYKDLEGLHHHDDFDVSLVVCHNAAPFEEQSDGERHLLRLRFYVIMTSQRELFPRLTADMRRFKKLPQIHRGGPEAQGLLYSSPLFPLLNNEVASACRQIQASVEQAMGHCRRDNLWRRLFHGEHLALDKLKLSKLSFSELEELLEAVQSRSVGEIDPQLDCFLTLSPAWYQSLIKVLLNRFPQSCRHFDDNAIQYLAVLNQKFTDCFVLVFLDSQAGKTSLKVVFREPLPSQPQASSSPPPQLVSMYHHLESVINTACYNLWTGLL
uniref:SZT2 subunit of KICSTOR complex n=1 Tax=Sparus aurata TaxID=8175 RepID=A0A671X8H5_SPAAU